MTRQNSESINKFIDEYYMSRQNKAKVAVINFSKFFTTSRTTNLEYLDFWHLNQMWQFLSRPGLIILNSGLNF
jgi:hypothetical protein